VYWAMKTFVCRGCVDPVAGVGHTGVDTGVGANLELVDGFCCLDDELGVDRGAGAAVETGFRVGWSGFRRLVPLLANRDVTDGEREIEQQLCARWYVARKWDLDRWKGRWGGTSAGRDGSG